MADPYFGESPVGQRRHVLLWAIAARRQLDRWEPLVARHLWSTYPQGTPMPDHEIWDGEVQHHFAIVALDHMLEALKLWPNSVVIPDIVRDEVAEVRDLLTHWTDNMPVFNMRPRKTTPPRRTGKSFAARHPDVSPYDWFAWTSRRGAMLTRSVSASDARQAIDSVEQGVLTEDPGLARFLPPVEQPSPWLIDEQGNWWPTQAAETI